MLKTRVEYAKDKPSFGRKEVERRFGELASLTLPENHAKQIIEVVDSLETLDNITNFTSLLRP